MYEYQRVISLRHGRLGYRETADPAHGTMETTLLLVLSIWHDTHVCTRGGHFVIESSS